MNRDNPPAFAGLIGYRALTSQGEQDTGRTLGADHDVLLASNGIFLQAEMPVGRLTVPHTPASARLPGLLPARPGVRLHHGPIPGRLLAAVLAEFRNAALREPPLEACAAIAIASGGGYWLHWPDQERAPGRVAYALHPELPVALVLHSHHRMPGFWSATDDADETGHGLFGVVGRFDHPVPEIRLRVGVDGHYWPLPLHEVFECSDSVHINCHDLVLAEWLARALGRTAEGVGPNVPGLDDWPPAEGD